MLTAVLLSAVLSAVVAIAVTLSSNVGGAGLVACWAPFRQRLFPPVSDWRWPPMQKPGREFGRGAYGMLINGCFLLVYVLVPPSSVERRRRGLVLTTTTALLVWSAFGALVLLALDPLLLRVAPVTLGLVGTLALAVMGVLVARGPRPAPAGHRSPGSIEIMARGLPRAPRLDWPCIFLDSELPLLAGLSSVFPAIFLTTMVGLWVSQSPDVPLGAAGPMLLAQRAWPSMRVWRCGPYPRLGSGGAPRWRGVCPSPCGPCPVHGGSCARIQRPLPQAGSGTPMTRSSTALMPRSANSAFRRASRSYKQHGQCGREGRTVSRHCPPSPRSMCSTRSTKGAPPCGSCQVRRRFASRCWRARCRALMLLAPQVPLPPRPNAAA